MRSGHLIYHHFFLKKLHKIHEKFRSQNFYPKSPHFFPHLTFQMEAEQVRLQNDLQRQSDNYNLILTRRDREHQEEDNLVTMLRSDVERLAAER